MVMLTCIGNTGYCVICVCVELKGQRRNYGNRSPSFETPEPRNHQCVSAQTKWNQNCCNKQVSPIWPVKK